MTTPIIPQNKDTFKGILPTIGGWFSDAIGWIASGYWSFIEWLFGPRHQEGSQGNDRLYLTVTRLGVLFSLFLVGVSFFGSYTAARTYAETNGIDPAVAGWIPVSVDGVILLSVLVVFGASLVGAKAGWVRLLIFSFAVISVIFNVAHIIQPKQLETNPIETKQAQPKKADVQHYLLGAIFPVVVFLASEVTSHQISAYIKRKDALKTNQVLATEIEARQQEMIILPQEIEQKRQAMLAQAQASIKAELAALDEQREGLQAEIHKTEAKLKSLNQKGENVYTEDDLRTAYLLGQNPDVTGSVVGNKLNKSVTIGNKQKNKVKPIVFNGAMTNGNN